MTKEEATRYGRYVAFLTQLYRDEGMDTLVDFLTNEDDFSAQMTLALMIRATADA